MAIQPGAKKKKTEMFICDSCGIRKRLDRGKRHWCDECNRGTPVEMRAVRDKWRKPAPQAPQPAENRAEAARIGFGRPSP